MNVLYRCHYQVAEGQICGQRHFMPPGGTKKKCTVHDEVLTQDEDYNSPDFLYIDAEGKTKSKRGHLDTPLMADPQNFQPGQRAVRRENVENFGPEQRVWTPAEDADLLDPDDELYPHTVEENAHGELNVTFQGSHMRDQDGPTSKVGDSVSGTDVANMSPEELADFNQRVSDEINRRNAEVLENRHSEEPAPQGEVVTVIPPADVSDTGHRERGPGGELTTTNDSVEYTPPENLSGLPEERAEREAAEAKEARVEALREEYFEVSGDTADRRWGESRLNDEIKAAKEGNEDNG